MGMCGVIYFTGTAIFAWIQKHSKKSAGVALEVNLRNLFNASEGSTIILNLRADATRSKKHGYQWSHKKDWCPPNLLFFFEKYQKLWSCPPVYGRLLPSLLSGIALGIPVGIQVLVDGHFTLIGGVILTTLRRRVTKVPSQQVLFFHEHHLCFR